MKQRVNIILKIKTYNMHLKRDYTKNKKINILLKRPL